jgi:hypothetical protein
VKGREKGRGREEGKEGKKGRKAKCCNMSTNNNNILFKE